MSGGRYLQQYSPARVSSPQFRAPSPRPSTEHDNCSRYLAELLHERQKLGPFTQVLPICSRLLDQEIFRAKAFVSNQGFSILDRLEHASPLSSNSLISNGTALDFTLQGGQQSEMINFPQASSFGWRASPEIPLTPVIKKVLRLDIPADSFPNFNFVGRLLGPRGNSLKRVEASTDCRIYIRGRGSVKDSAKEQSLRGKPGYEHLNEPLHILIEAELPANVIDAKMNHAREIIAELLRPVDESHDYVKRQQLRELALLNGAFREESPHLSGSNSPFTNSGLKRAKTGI
eukprot:TRINITY_DN2071_c1_g1_i1.p1 TRINITY_DN2071_c1_g1~~TRINITY_DN2071_c1_g1_i1.p1  ORF type:complete len:288 (+),score=46.23 TRINITY_DN2071_c1_g1_i1:134-997(+)